MNIPPGLLAAFPASDQLLLDVARRQIDDGMLREIAEADYGFDADTHLAQLRPIRDQGIVPASMAGHPAQVLALIRWSNPADPNHKPGSTGRRGHQMRAFACAALLRVEMDEATLAQCLASAQVLGEEMSEAAARFLTWGIPLVESKDRWLFALGLLIVAARFRSGRVEDRVLGDAAAWVLTEEAEVCSELRPRFNPSNPPPAAVGLGWGLWKPLAAELIANAAAVQANDVRSELEFIGTMLLD